MSEVTSEVTMEKWVYGGEAMARIDGRVVFAPFTLPGETAKIEAKPGEMHASLVEVTAPSADRIAPKCPLFARCGGCHYQHASYDFQVARKVEILREQLRRVGKITWEGEINVLRGPEWGYRNRAQFRFKDGKLGYLEAGSHELVPLEGECPIASPRLNQALAEMRDRTADRHFPRFVQILEIFTNEEQIQVNVVESERPVAQVFYQWCGSTLALEYPTAHGVYKVSPRSFFQVNRFLIDALVDAAVGKAEGSSALDLYAGVGLFALPLAKKFERVTAIEGGVTASRDLEENARLNDVKIRSIQGRVEDQLRKIDAAPDFVVADPPRAGLGKSVTAELERLKPQRLTIVSCDPATLARDLAALPAYAIDTITLADLFPQTYHMETVVELRRR